MVSFPILKRLALVVGLLLALLAVPARLTGTDDNEETGGAKQNGPAART